MAHAEIWFPHDQFSVKWATISPWVMWKSDFHMGHVEIWFLVISAIGDFTNFLKMYGNLSMAIAYTNSLSKCLKYPGFIFLCPQKLSKKNPRKKTKSLNYPNTIPEFFSEFGYVQDFFYVPRTIRGKKTNTLNYPNSIRYFGDLAKFSGILHENKKIL